MMLVIGLTGSIGMGKSTAAAYLAKRGVPVFDADAEVHRLYEADAVPAIAKEFPTAVRGGKVDRAALAREIGGRPDRLKALEGIVHPMVIKSELDFLRAQDAQGEALAALEIPLLFETDAIERVDVTIVVSAPHHIQRHRVLGRAGMTVEKLEHLLARQLPDAEKRARADFTVDSGAGLSKMHRELDMILESLRGREGRVMERLRKSK